MSIRVRVAICGGQGSLLTQRHWWQGGRPQGQYLQRDRGQAWVRVGLGLVVTCRCICQDRGRTEARVESHGTIKVWLGVRARVRVRVRDEGGKRLPEA